MALMLDECKKKILTENIEITLKFIGSVLHYIIQETFESQPNILKNKISLFNYFRNYKNKNEELEKLNDVMKNDNVFEVKDLDGFEALLVDKDVFNEFWKVNKTWIETIKKYILQWSVNLGKYIKTKYEK